MPPTIAERDHEFYQACVDQHQTDLWRCAPHKESQNRALMLAAIAVRNAVSTYMYTQEEAAAVNDLEAIRARSAASAVEFERQEATAADNLTATRHRKPNPFDI